MESLDGNGIVCKKLMTVVRRQQQDGLWWGETRWEVWIFDLTDRQRHKVCCCRPTSSLMHYNYCGAVAACLFSCLQPCYYWVSILEKNIFFPHFSPHSCLCLMMHERSCMCVFLSETPPSQGWVCYLSSDRDSSRKYDAAETSDLPFVSTRQSALQSVDRRPFSQKICKTQMV